jgi:hypothetical protein
MVTHIAVIRALLVLRLLLRPEPLDEDTLSLPDRREAR